MQSGFKNLQRLSRSYSREQRLQENGHAGAVQDIGSHVPHGHTRHHSGQVHAPVLGYNPNRNSVGRYDHGDDSGISVFEDTDNGYSPNETSFRSSGEYISNEPMIRNEEHWNPLRTMQGRDTLGVLHPQAPQQSYARLDSRLDGRLDGRIDQRYAMQSPGVQSTDMRIPSLINAPNNGTLSSNGLNGHGHESSMGRRGAQDPGNGMNSHMNGNGMGGQRQGNGGRN